MPVETLQTGRWPWVRVEILLATVLFVLSLALDYKGQAGASGAQIAMAVVNTVAFLGVAVQHRAKLPLSGLAGMVVWGWVLYLAVGSVSALVWQVHPGHFLRILYQYSLLVAGFLVGWWSSRTEWRVVNRLVDAMLVAAGVSLVYSAFRGWQGSVPGDGHFSILSPLTPFVFAAAGYDLLFARRHRMLALLLMVFAAAVTAVSRVRGMMVVIVALVCVIGLAASWRLAAGQFLAPRRLVRGIFLLLLLMTAGIVVVELAEPRLLHAWRTGLMGAGDTANFWTRVAAVSGQWHSLTENTAAILTGLGFGHDYMRSTAFVSLTAPYFPGSAYGRVLWYPGEFMWITPWFYSGVVAGSVAVAVLGAMLLRCVRNLAEIMRSGGSGFALNRARAIGSLGFAAFVGISFTSDPFMSRLGPVFMGLCMGLAVLPSHRPALREAVARHPCLSRDVCNRGSEAVTGRVST